MEKHLLSGGCRDAQQTVETANARHGGRRAFHSLFPFNSFNNVRMTLAGQLASSDSVDVPCSLCGSPMKGWQVLFICPKGARFLLSV